MEHFPQYWLARGKLNIERGKANLFCNYNSCLLIRWTMISHFLRHFKMAVLWRLDSLICRMERLVWCVARTNRYWKKFIFLTVINFVPLARKWCEVLEASSEWEEMTCSRTQLAIPMNPIYSARVGRNWRTSSICVPKGKWWSLDSVGDMDLVKN